MDRKIVHIDMDAFYASVEQRDNPDLRGKPVVVGGNPNSRGVVAACSYEARVFGIHSAMPSSRAAKLCPDVVFLKPRFDAYREASRQIHRVFKRYAQAVEPLSLDEAYLDVTEAAQRFGSATEVARRIKQEILAETNLTASAGVSYNKFLAKIASDLDKPDGLAVITPTNAQALIEGLEIRKFHGIGRVTEAKMQKLGIYSGLDLKQLSLVQLQTHFGRVGEYYYNIARGLDNRTVSRSRKSKSIGSETTFADNVVDKKFIWETLTKLAGGVVTSLDKRNYAARTVTIKARYADFELITRSKTPEKPVFSIDDFKAWMPELLKRTEVGRRPIRLIGVTAHNIIDRADQTLEPDTSEDPPQLGLF
jgi:DNA polymerase-4